MFKRLGMAGFLGAGALAGAASSLLSVRLLIFALILVEASVAVFALAVKIDARKKKL